MENTGEEQEVLTTKDVTKLIINDFIIFIIGILVSMCIFIHNVKNKTLNNIKNIFYTLLPVTLSTIIFFIYHSPKPKLKYVLSVLYDNKPIVSDYVHQNNKGWPFVASVAIIINERTHIFVGGGDGQDDALLYYDNDKNNFVNVIDKTNISSKSNTYSGVAFDMDDDGKDDLVVGRSDGVYLYKSMGGYKFKMIKIVNKMDKVPLGIAISDYNKDKKPDIYVSYFTPITKYRGTVFNDPKHGRKNMLLKNTSNGKRIRFKNVTAKTNSSGHLANTFTSAFIDLNNDTWPDLVLSHDSNEMEILRNNKGKFVSITPYDGKGNYMGIASGDVDSDGDQDIFLTNIGTDIIKNKLSLGDIQPQQKQTFRHILLRNDGDFKFIESSKDYGIKGNGFGWGTIFSDIDSNGDLELLFAENTLLYPLDHVFPMPNHYYKKNKYGKYQREFKYNNHHFGQTPMALDINNDNYLDIVWINMRGPAISYINNETTNNYLIINLPQTSDFVNAKVVLDTGTKKIYKENIKGGLGFGGDDNVGNIYFGLGKLNKIKNVKIYTIHNKEYVINKPKINSIIKPKVLLN